MSNALKTSEENREKDDILKESERLEIEKKVELARENLRKILKYFDVFDYDESFSLEGNLLKIELKGDNLDFLIRSEGKLLNAIQYVVVLMTNNVYEGHIKIVLDCNGFRERRKEEIKVLSTIVGLYHFIMPILGMLFGKFILNFILTMK